MIPAWPPVGARRRAEGPDDLRRADHGTGARSLRPRDVPLKACSALRPLGNAEVAAECLGAFAQVCEPARPMVLRKADAVVVDDKYDCVAHRYVDDDLRRLGVASD